MIAAALSVAMLVASIVGAAAHAGEHSHHRHHHRDHHHGAGAISPQADHAALHAPVASSDIDFQLIDDEPQHAGCLDFICHGGVAVLGATTPWNIGFWPTAPVFPWCTQALDAVSPARLDRPPKSFVSA